MVMEKRKLGNIEVTEIGIGTMAFSHGYGKIPDEKYSIEAIREAYNHGCNFFDTAEVYSPNLAGIGHNELIVGKALKDVRDKVVIATKLFLKSHEVVNGDVYGAIKKHLLGSMERLQVKMVDLYYLHRLSDVPLEEIAKAMGRLINEGLIRGWGLSQVDVDSIEKAHKITPVSAIQNLYNILERDSEEKIIPFCLKNNIGFVPFSPVGSGLLSGKINANTQFEKNDDVRNWVPQCKKENIIGNQPIIDLISKWAEKKGATPAQISMAWMIKKYPNVVPIPGSKNKERIIENINTYKVKFTDDELNEFENELKKYKVHGHRGIETGWWLRVGSFSRSEATKGRAH
jgi:aryl-alcohol dehydrogenase-like predicted oxidoreductase